MGVALAEHSRVLVVEDHEPVARLVCKLLEREGYHSQWAANGEKALDVLADGYQPGLILLDVMMPVMDGFQFLDVIHNSTQWQEIPVVMLTAIDDAPSVIKAMKGGALEYCTKPIDPAELISSVQRLLPPEVC